MYINRKEEERKSASKTSTQLAFTELVADESGNSIFVGVNKV